MNPLKYNPLRFEYYLRDSEKIIKKLDRRKVGLRDEAINILCAKMEQITHASPEEKAKLLRELNTLGLRGKLVLTPDKVSRQPNLKNTSYNQYFPGHDSVERDSYVSVDSFHLSGESSRAGAEKSFPKKRSKERATPSSSEASFNEPGTRYGAKGSASSLGSRKSNLKSKSESSLSRVDSRESNLKSKSISSLSSMDLSKFDLSHGIKRSASGGYQVPRTPV